jgi:hypothetical protein
MEEIVEDGDDARDGFEMGAIAAWMLVMCSCSESDDREPRNSFPQCGHRARRTLSIAVVSPEYQIKYRNKSSLSLNIRFRKKKI